MAYKVQFLHEFERLAPTAHYNAAQLAQLCGISPRQLERAFREVAGCPPQHWLNAQKILLAQNLLLSGRQLKQIAFDLRYKQLSHFCRQFKSFTNMTPSEFLSLNTAEHLSQIDNTMSLRDNKKDSMAAPPF